MVVLIRLLEKAMLILVTPEFKGEGGSRTRNSCEIGLRGMVAAAVKNTGTGGRG